MTTTVCLVTICHQSYDNTDDIPCAVHEIPMTYHGKVVPLHPLYLFHLHQLTPSALDPSPPYGSGIPIRGRTRGL